MLSSQLLRVIVGVIALFVLSMSTNSQAFGASETVLWNFGGPADGSKPYCGLITDASGNFYGTTLNGGFYGKGTIFKLQTDGTESVLWSFGSGTDGQNPYAGLIADAQGNLYGTTTAGGLYGKGTAFVLTTVGKESILWSFGNGADGSTPYDGLIFDASGNLYGTTHEGGSYGQLLGGYGTAFELMPPAGSGNNWTESILWNFGNPNDGVNPAAGFIMDGSGNLYGTTQGGGNGLYGTGTVFELTPPISLGGSWTESILWSFNGWSIAGSRDGSWPNAGLLMDKSGNLYGTTSYGGSVNGLPGVGVVFELTPPSTVGGPWSESVLWNFGPKSGPDASEPFAGLIMDPSGTLYGTTTFGGSEGAVFALTPPSIDGGSWTEAVLWGFGGITDGEGPGFGSLILDTAGNLYGTTIGGGIYYGSAPGGTVFEITNIGATPTPTPTPTMTPTATPTVTPVPALLSVAAKQPNFGHSFYGDSGEAGRSKSFTVSNRSKEVSILLEDIEVTGANAGDFAITSGGVSSEFASAEASLTPCSSSLPPKGKCGITILFTPGGLGSRAATLTVTGNQSNGVQSVILTGMGVAPRLTLAPRSLTFSRQSVTTTSATKTITLTNRSPVDLTISSVSSSDPVQFSASGCTQTLPKNGGACQISVAFTPGSVGMQRASVTITDNALKAPQTINMTGVGR